MTKGLRWIVNGGTALLLLAAAVPAFAQGTAAWPPVTGDVQWSCGGKVETWATWQAEWVDGHATGAIRDYQQHSAGTCPSGGSGGASSAAWKTVTGNITWPCSGVENWVTWQAEYVGGQATGATRDFQAFASGDCPRSSGSTSVTPAGTVLALPFPPEDLSVGPSAGDLAATNGTSKCVVVLGGKVADTIPLCNSIAWVPGSQWVVHDTLAPPTIQGSVEQDVVAVRYTGDTAGAPVTVPCANGVPQLVQPVSGPAVSYLCHGVLDIFPLGIPGAMPKTYGFAKVSGPFFVLQPPLLVDPTGTYVAMRRSNGWVNVYRLSDGSEISGTYMAGNPVAWAWSNSGALALINASGGVTVWRPGSGAVTVATPNHPYGYRLLWKPDGSGVLVLSTLLTGLGSAPSGGVVVDPNGHTQTFAPKLPAGDFVLALTPGGKHMWYGPEPDTMQRAGTFTMTEAPLP